MIKLSKNMIRVLVATLVLAVVAVVAVYTLTGASDKKVTANFASGVGVYPGTPVKVLGIQVGTVTKVKPMGDSVLVDMTYGSKYKLPAGAQAYLVANSLVSDRYVQLAPAYSGGPVMAGGANIPLNRTASPAELDDIYGALNQLSVALGPNGANKNGALSTLVNVTAANLNGNGKAFAASIKNLSDAAATLANGREDLFGTVSNLRVFTDALSQSDAQVRTFNNLLAQVAGDLADERGDLGLALHNLTIALHQVAGFVQTNAGKLHTDVLGLETLTNILVKDQGALSEVLAVGPVALANLTHANQESTGTLGTRSNLSDLTSLSAANICAALNDAVGGLSKVVGNVLGPLTSQIVAACGKVGPLPTLPSLLTGLLGLPTIPGVGG